MLLLLIFTLWEIRRRLSKYLKQCPPGPETNACALLLLELDAQQRLTFLDAAGYDRFGNNELFAPLIKWETFKTQLTALRNNARDYESAYNGIQTSIQQNSGIKEIAQTISTAARIQVDNQKSRLQAAKTTATNEKNVYVQVRSKCSVLLCHGSVQI